MRGLEAKICLPILAQNPLKNAQNALLIENQEGCNSASKNDKTLSQRRFESYQSGGI